MKHSFYFYLAGNFRLDGMVYQTSDNVCYVYRSNSRTLYVFSRNETCNVDTAVPIQTVCGLELDKLKNRWIKT